MTNLLLTKPVKRVCTTHFSGRTSIIPVGGLSSVGGSSGNDGGAAAVFSSRNPYLIFDLRKKLDLLLTESEFYLGGPTQLNVVGEFSTATNFLHSLELLIPTTIVNELVLQDCFSDSDVVKFESFLSALIVQHKALPIKFLETILDTSNAKATEMVASLAKSRRLRYRFLRLTICLFIGFSIAAVIGLFIGFPARVVDLFAVVLTVIGFQNAFYPQWQNRNNVDVKRICLLKTVANCTGEILARVQALKGYAEEGKMACVALHAANSPQVDFHDRNSLIAEVLDSIKNHSDKLKECAQYINHAVESVLNDAISYAI